VAEKNFQYSISYNGAWENNPDKWFLLLSILLEVGIQERILFCFSHAQLWTYR
jgi:hypothetical protein